MVVWHNRWTWTWTRIGAVAVVCAGLGLGVSACGGTAGAAGAATTSSAAPASGAKAHDKRDGVAGRITAENGDSWVITTKAGKTITVDITPNTKFGTTDHPATEQQFPVGSTVRVSGAVDGDTVSAARIAIPQQRTGPSASVTPTPAPTT